MPVNRDLQMSQYSDLLAGKFTPADLRYGVQKLSNYRRITQRLQPLAGTSFTAGNLITFRLPPNSLIPLDSVRIIGDLSATVTCNSTGNVSVLLNKNADMCLWQSLVCKSGGRNIDNQQNYYSQIGAMYADMVSEDNAKSIRSALVNDTDITIGNTTYGAKTDRTATPAVTTATVSRPVCIKDFLGFLNSGYTVSTTQEFLPNFEIHGVLNPVENIIQIDTVANLATATYTFSNVYAVFDLITFADPNPYQMALARVSGMGIPLSMKFKNYYAVNRSGINSDFSLPLNMSSHCLQRLYAIIRDDANASAGVKAQETSTYNSKIYTRTQNGLSNCRFQIGDLNLPTFWDSSSGSSEYALYNLATAFGIQKDTRDGMSAIKDFRNALAANGTSTTRTTTANELFANYHYVFCQSLDHIASYEEGMLSGLNTRGIAQDVYFLGTLSASSNVLVVGESAAVLTILPNSEISVEY
jgi:hypothetical protein